MEEILELASAETDSGELSLEEKKELLSLLKQKQKYREFNKSEYFKPYPYQKRFFELGATNRFRFLMAGNRIGKTYSQAYETYLALTGAYPPDWKGRVFKKPINCWFLAVSVEQCKDVGQKELLGTSNAKAIDEIGTGAIPRRYIDMNSIERDGARVVRARIKHFTNGIFDGYSTLTFKTSQADDSARMGSHVDYSWIDELPPFDDLDIYSQLVTRCMADPDEQSSVTVTGTPEKGYTQLVQHFVEKTKEGEKDIAYLQAGWKDAHENIGGHLTDSIIKTMMANIPAYQLEMRMTGSPILGDGLIYPYNIRSNNVCDPFPIPDSFKKLCALDIGIGHETAACWVAHDPNTDNIYVYDTYAQKDGTPDIHAIAINKRGRNIPVVLPHDAAQRQKNDGLALKETYKQAGVNALSDLFYNAGRAYTGKKTIAVDTGIVEISQRLNDKQLFIFSTCQELIRGIEVYSYKKGIPDKTSKYDDLLDAFRYAVMSVARRGKSESESNVNHNRIYSLDMKTI